MQLNCFCRLKFSHKPFMYYPKDLGGHSLIFAFQPESLQDCQLQTKSVLDYFIFFFVGFTNETLKLELSTTF